MLNLSMLNFNKPDTPGNILSWEYIIVGGPLLKYIIIHSHKQIDKEPTPLPHQWLPFLMQGNNALTVVADVVE